jgi:N-acetylmuramoyl-L-alanine amidase
MTTELDVPTELDGITELDVPTELDGMTEQDVPTKLDGVIDLDVTTESDATKELNMISDPVKGFNIEYTKDDSLNLYTATINIALDNIYAPILYQDEDNIYIDLSRPKDVYKKIIVIDAGHGGTDCGTFSKGELYYEKDINLSILSYLKEILDQKDIKVYYTRTTDKTVYLNPRVNLANDLEADFFLSIHCNSNESSVPDGSEVLYNELVQTGGFQSKQLAQICMEEILKVTQKVNRGLVNGSEMVIIKKANMPVALTEVGFMSNQGDLDFLLQDENRKKIAGALYNVIVRAYEELEP